MKLRITKLFYSPSTKTLLTTIIDEDDPEGVFRVVVDEDTITLTKQNTTIVQEAHSIAVKDWNHGNASNAIKAKFESLLGGRHDAPNHINSMFQAFNQVLGQLGNASSNWENYQTNNQLMVLSTARAHMNNALDHAARAGIVLEGLSNRDDYPELTKAHEPTQTEVERVARLAEETISARIKETETGFERIFVQLENNLTTKANEIVEIADRARATATTANTMAQNIQETLIKELLSEEGELKKQASEMNTRIKQLVDEALAYQEEKKTEIEALLEKSGKTERQLARLTQKEAADAMTRQFQSAASDAAGNAVNWTAGFFLVGLSAVGCILGLIYWAPTPQSYGELGWLSIFGRLSLTAAMAYMLGYSGLQATRQRNANLYFKRMAIEMVALDAYLAPYDDEVALEIKSELMKAYFGKVDAPGYQKEGNLPSIDILGRVSYVLARRKAQEETDDKADDTKVDDLAKKLLEKGGVNAVDLALKLLTLEDKKDAPTKDDKPS